MTPLSLPHPSSSETILADAVPPTGGRTQREQPAVPFEAFLPEKDHSSVRSSESSLQAPSSLPPESAIYTLASRTSLLGPDEQATYSTDPGEVGEEPEPIEAIWQNPDPDRLPASPNPQERVQADSQSEAEHSEQPQDAKAGANASTVDELHRDWKKEGPVYPENGTVPSRSRAVSQGSPHRSAATVTGVGDGVPQHDRAVDVTDLPQAHPPSPVSPRLSPGELRGTEPVSQRDVQTLAQRSDAAKSVDGVSARLPEQPRSMENAIPRDIDTAKMPVREANAEIKPKVAGEPPAPHRATGIPVSPQPQGRGAEGSKPLEPSVPVADRLASVPVRGAELQTQAQPSSASTEGDRLLSRGAEAFAQRAFPVAEKTSERTSRQMQSPVSGVNENAKATYNQSLREFAVPHGTPPATREVSMKSLLDTDTQDPVSAPTLSSTSPSVAPTAEPGAAPRTGSLQQLVEQVHQLTQRLAETGKNQFQLEWGGNGNERIRVEVSLRDGRWQVEFRTADPELTRFLDKEWNRSQQTRSHDFEREADVAFRFDDASSGQDRGRQDSEQAALHDAEATLLRHYRSLRYARNHS